MSTPDPVYVCLDLNGVLLDTQAGLRAHAAKRVGVIIPSTMTCKEKVGTQCANVVRGGRRKVFTAEDHETVKNEFFDSIVFLDAPAMPGAAEALCELAELGFVLQVVSDSKTLTEEQVMRWLEKNKFPHERINIKFTRGRSKERYQCRCDIVVDDSIEKLTPLLRRPTWPIPVHFLPSAVSSRQDEIPFDSSIVSLRGWDEVLPFIRDLQQPVSATRAA